MHTLRASSIIVLASLACCSEAPAPKPPIPAVPGPAATVPATTVPSTTGPAITIPASGADVVVDPAKWKTSTSADDPAFIEVAGLRGPKPASWVWTKPVVQFRTLQYAVAGELDSTKSAELIVSLFVGDGGPIDANITRWANQFRVGDAAAEPKLAAKEIGPLKVEFVELEGSYLAMGAAAPKAGFAQVGAIVQARGRNVFFRLIGPKETVDANRAAFMKLIDGLMPAD